MTQPLTTAQAAWLWIVLERCLAPSVVAQIMAEVTQKPTRPRQRVSLAESATRAAVEADVTVNNIAVMRAKKAPRD